MLYGRSAWGLLPEIGKDSSFLEETSTGIQRCVPVLPVSAQCRPGLCLVNVGRMAGLRLIISVLNGEVVTRPIGRCGAICRYSLTKPKL
jgi:hypothetical protein